MSDNQVSSGHVDPNAEPPRSPFTLLLVIALTLGALLVFGALDR